MPAESSGGTGARRDAVFTRGVGDHSSKSIPSSNSSKACGGYTLCAERDARPSAEEAQGWSTNGCLWEARGQCSPPPPFMRGLAVLHSPSGCVLTARIGEVWSAETRGVPEERYGGG